MKLVIYSFSKKYKDKLTSLRLIDRVMLLKVYVDDQNQAGWTFPYGTMYLKGKIHIPGLGWRGRANKGDFILEQEKAQVEIESSNLARTLVTIEEREAWSAAVYRRIANDLLLRSIKMKEDTPGNHSNRRLPILDTEVQVVNGKILHYHYLKPMSSLEVILKKS